jgi:hypothetical protein
MTERGLAEILLKLLGVYWLAEAAASLLSVASFGVGSPADWSSWVYPIVATLGYAALGAWLIAKAPAIAVRLASSGGGTSAAPAATAQEIAFSLLGAYLATVGAAALIGDVAQFDLLNSFPSPGVSDNAFAGGWASVATHLIYLAAGIGLFVGSRNLARLWRRLHPLAKGEGDDPPP